MKWIRSAGAACVAMMAFGSVLFIFAASALAADADWRPTYDMAMRWINFIILVAVIVKYAREPFKDFLKFKKEDVVEQIDALDKDKARILSEIDAVKQQEIENRNRLNEMKDRLIAQAEMRKQQIIEQAKQQSTIMLEETRRKMAHRIEKATATIKMELLDMAIDQAIATLPRIMTTDDSQRLLDDFMERIHA